MTHRREFLIGAVALAASPSLAAPRSSRLFNGRNLDGWAVVGDANWSVENGVVSQDRGGFSFLVSRESFRDFRLRIEFWVSDDANSGVFIRCSDRERITVDTAYEVNIFDRRPDPTFGTGAIVGIAPVSPMPRAGGRWNRMVIAAHDDRFDVAMNGQTTVDGARDGTRREGPIALQYGAGTVRFRDVRIERL